MLLFEFLITLGEKLAHYRKYENLTQDQLAQKIGVSKNTIYRFENGENVGTVVLAKILAHFDMKEHIINAIPDIEKTKKLPKEFTEWK